MPDSKSGVIYRLGASPLDAFLASWPLLEYSLPCGGWWDPSVHIVIFRCGSTLPHLSALSTVQCILKDKKVRTEHAYQCEVQGRTEIRESWFETWLMTFQLCVKVQIVQSPWQMRIIIASAHWTDMRIKWGDIYMYINIPTCTYLHMLRCFSSMWLFVTPWTITRKAPLSMGFSRQEY